MTAPQTPSVIIVGAGLGGLMLAILLEQINVPYHIFERATKVKPLGTAHDHFQGGSLKMLTTLTH
jgi:2-polyprenyl-6-methoxyphenol hydroxylase-like FAD-dependent oxidoreductase